MTWKELLKLEPRLQEVEEWARTLRESDFETKYTELKRRLGCFVGWGREIPGYERVPYPEGVFWTAAEEWEHDEKHGNRSRRSALFRKIPAALRVLYDSDAWDVALAHLMKIADWGEYGFRVHR